MSDLSNVSLELQRLLGARVRELREGRNLTRDELAVLAGTSAVNLARIENGDRFVGSGSLERLAAGLKVPVKDLFTYDTSTASDRETFQKLVDLLQNEDDRTLRLIHDVAARILKDL